MLAPVHTVAITAMTISGTSPSRDQDNSSPPYAIYAITLNVLSASGRQEKSSLHVRSETLLPTDVRETQFSAIWIHNKALII
jgi:hypothetical protein